MTKRHKVARLQNGKRYGVKPDGSLVELTLSKEELWESLRRFRPSIQDTVFVRFYSSSLMITADEFRRMVDDAPDPTAKFREIAFDLGIAAEPVAVEGEEIEIRIGTFIETQSC